MSIIDKVLGLAKQVSALVGNIPLLKGIPVVGTILAVAEQATNVISAVRDTVGEKDAVKLDAALAELEARVAAHHKSTMDKLTDAEDDV